MSYDDTMSGSPPFRWGIMGTAGIARKNWQAIRNTGEAVVAAVASRELKRAKKFVRECQMDAPFEKLPTAYGSYEDLLRDKNVDAVYLPLPTGLRKEWVFRAAEARKHVICEKPCGVSAADVREMIDACKKYGVQFMDGVMFMHNARLNRLREVLEDHTSIGHIKRIQSIFSFAVSEEFFRDNIRVNSEMEPAGCLGDLGWYCIRFSLWAMRWQLPRAVTAHVLSQAGASNSPGPVPTDFSGELVFNDEATAGFFCSFFTAKQQWVNISGTKGYLRVHDFVHPLSDHEPTFEVNNLEERVKCCDCGARHTKSKAMAQDSNLFRNFALQARSGWLNDDWPMFALKTQQVMDACMESARRGGRVILVK